jgi:hypothetical protein
LPARGNGPLSDQGAAEVHTGEVRASKVRAGEVRASEVPIAEVRVAEVRAEKVRAGEVRVAEVRVAEVREYENRQAKVGRSAVASAVPATNSSDGRLHVRARQPLWRLGAGFGLWPLFAGVFPNVGREDFDHGGVGERPLGAVPGPAGQLGRGGWFCAVGPTIR